MRFAALIRIFVPSTEIEDLQQLRERLLNTLLLSASVLGTVLYLLAVGVAIQESIFYIAVLYTVFYVWLLVITFFQKLPFEFRSNSWLFFLYTFGTINLILSGFNVDAGLYFITYIVMTVLFFSIKRGMAALLLSSATIAFIGYFIVNHQINFELGLPQTNPMLWIIGAAILLIMGFVISGSFATLINGLEFNLNKSLSLTKELVAKNKALQESDSRYKSLVETSPDAILLLDLDGKIVMMNQAGLSLLGVHILEEISGENIADFVPEEDRPILDNLVQQVKEEGVVKDVETSLVRVDGAILQVEFSVSILRDAYGTPTSLIGVGKDVTARNIAQQKILKNKDLLEQQVHERTADLKKTSERLRELVEYSPVTIYSARPSEPLNFTWVSKNVGKLSGYEAYKLTAKPGLWSDRIHPEDFSSLMLAKATGLEKNGAVCTYRLTHQNGETRWIHDAARLIRHSDGTPLEIVGSLVDITSRVQSEIDLKKSEEKHHSLFESMIDGYVSVSMDGKIEEFNDTYRSMLGYEAHELYKLTYVDITPQKWHAFEAAIVEKQILAQGYSDVYIKEYRKKDGTIFPVELRTLLIRDTNGKPSGMWAIVRDITERKELEAKVRESDEQYRILAESSQEIIAIVDAEQQVKYANSFAARLVGKAPTEMLGWPFQSVFHLDSTHQLVQDIRKAFDNRSTVRNESKVKIKQRYIWLDSNLVPLKNDTGQANAVLIISRDITKRKKAESNLKKLSKDLEKRVEKRTAELEEHRFQLRQLTQHVISEREYENRFFSRELHDGAGQKLIILKNAIMNIPAHLSDDTDVDARRFKDLVESLDDLIELIRSISHRMRPPVLEVGGLNISLEELCRECCNETDLKINYRGQDIPGLTDDIGISLYRVAQEALANIFRHSKATEADVQLAYKKGFVQLTVKDNGIGYSGSSQTEADGIGLIGIEERLRVLGGSFEILRNQKQGTLLRAQIPWQENDPYSEQHLQ